MMIKSSEGGIISVLPVAHRGKLPVVAELAIDVVVLPWGNQHITTLHFSLAGLLFPTTLCLVPTVLRFYLCNNPVQLIRAILNWISDQP